MKQGGQVELWRCEQGVLVIQDAQPALWVEHEILALEIAEAERGRQRRDVPGELSQTRSKGLVQRGCHPVFQKVAKLELNPLQVEAPGEREPLAVRECVDLRKEPDRLALSLEARPGREVAQVSLAQVLEQQPVLFRIERVDPRNR